MEDSRSDSGIPWYAGKEATRQYLEEVNKDKKVRHPLRYVVRMWF